MQLVNFHADTPFRISREALPFDSPLLMAGSASHLCYEHSFEVYAIWSDRRLSDSEAWSDFFKILSDFRAALAASAAPIPEYRLALEDARILEQDPNRLGILAAAGISILIPFWSGENALGGAHDTETGLTDLGREIIRGCFSYGIVPDVSHASDASANGILDIAEELGRPVIASHSNFRAVLGHSRNIPDRIALRIAALGGIVGLSMVPEHLSKDGNAKLGDLLAQIEHGLSLIPHSLALGTDYDGIDKTPRGLPDTSALPLLAEQLRRCGVPASAIDALFYKNGLRFIRAHLPRPPALCF